MVSIWFTITTPNGLLIWQKGQVSYEAEYQTKYPLRFFRQTERQSEENKKQGTSILSDFKLTGSLIMKSVMVIFLVVYLGRL